MHSTTAWQAKVLRRKILQTRPGGRGIQLVQTRTLDTIALRVLYYVEPPPSNAATLCKLRPISFN